MHYGSAVRNTSREGTNVSSSSVGSGGDRLQGRSKAPKDAAPHQLVNAFKRRGFAHPSSALCTRTSKRNLRPPAISTCNAVLFVGSLLQVTFEDN